METWIAPLRGINVGGRNRLPMSDLKSSFKSLRLKNVRTYIQSGIVLESPGRRATALSKKIAGQIEKRHGFRSLLFIINSAELAAAILSNPFQQAVAKPETLHFYFLAEPATKPNWKALESTCELQS